MERVNDELEARGVRVIAVGRAIRDLAKLKKLSAGLHRAGVDRVGTWLSPSHGQLSYDDNFKRHAGRLKKAAKASASCGLNRIERAQPSPAPSVSP